MQGYDVYAADEVAYHPAYHDLLGTAGFLVWSQVDAGVGCPASMSDAFPVLA